ncbi:DMT family transporter [Actinomadura rupiterrae]|uniref:DMT family transporter n=1 Tax=Actinomadura rupiterrae TaxID=559627 RepID=UPI0020A3C011|nr:EamA family transporter [Actinomadura rupiterrae]MCP2340497.1 putative membrane protein [Actinomadura rupiterrae]
MITLLALGAALSYGVADFLGGTVTRHSSTLKALFWCVPAGLAVLAASALLTGRIPTATSLTWGFVAGLAGGAGLMTFYRALARGPMSVVAPVSALASALLPIAVGVARGERLDATVLAGVLICLVAIALVSMEKSDGPSERSGNPLDNGPLMAGISGICFGLFFVLVKTAGTSGGLWPLVAARAGNLAVVALALAVVLARGGSPGTGVSGRRLIGLAVLSGALDASANVLYYLAVNSGLLSLAAVLTSLYPAITVLLARIAYSERLRTVQRLGLALAATGVTLVTVG